MQLSTTSLATSTAVRGREARLPTGLLRGVLQNLIDVVLADNRVAGDKGLWLPGVARLDDFWNLIDQFLSRRRKIDTERRGHRAVLNGLNSWGGGVERIHLHICPAVLLQSSNRAHRVVVVAVEDREGPLSAGVSAEPCIRCSLS